MNAENEMDINLFEIECNASLGFLVQEYGFTGPASECPLPGLFKVTYLKDEIGIECVYEQREDDLSMFLLHLNHGVKQDCFKRNEAGEIVRARLTELLIRRGIRGLNLIRNRDVGLDTHKRLSRQEILRGYAELIAKYAPEVLAGSADMFRTYPADPL
jgi:hypothetical protein